MAEVPLYKTYSDGYSVRGMTAEDGKVVVKWFESLDIDIPIHDLALCLSVFPESRGSYIGEYEGKVVASCIRLPWGGGAYYGSMYFVHEEYRRQGFGTRMRNDVAYGHVTAAGGTVCIDAIFDGNVAENNRKKYGHKDVWTTTRYEWDVMGLGDANNDISIVKACNVEFDKLMDYDNQCFVSKDNPQRREFMRRWIKLPGGAAYVAIDQDGTVCGLGCRRPCIQNGNHEIGPIYAESTVIAKSLLQALCDDVIGQHVCLNVWGPNTSSVEMLKDIGFKKAFDLAHQHCGGELSVYKQQVYAVTSVDVCGF